MKAIKTGIAMCLGLFSLGISATNNNEAEKEIKEKIHINQQFLNNEDKVEILFTTDEKGEVNFALARTNNEMLRKEIEKQFHSLHFTKMKKDVVNSVTLNFKIK